MSLKREFCPTCWDWKPSVAGVNHILHLLLSVATASLWLPVWLLMTLTTGRRCTTCGSETRTTEEPKFEFSKIGKAATIVGGAVAFYVVAVLSVAAMIYRSILPPDLSAGDQIIISSQSPQLGIWMAFADEAAEAKWLRITKDESAKNEIAGLMLYPAPEIVAYEEPARATFQRYDEKKTRAYFTAKLEVPSKSGRMIAVDFSGYVHVPETRLTPIDR